MKTLNTDLNNDIFLEKKGFSFAFDAYAVASVAEKVLQTQRGELRYDFTRGIPWFETVFSSIRNLKAWEAAAILAIKDSSGVSGITSFEYRITGRVLSYLAKINSIYGEAAING